VTGRPVGFFGCYREIFVNMTSNRIVGKLSLIDDPGNISASSRIGFDFDPGTFINGFTHCCDAVLRATRKKILTTLAKPASFTPDPLYLFN
jgi:hypothetical protein